MIRSLSLLLLMGWAIPAFSQQTDKPLRMDNRKAGTPFGPLTFRNDSLTIKGVYKNYRHAAGDLFKVTGYDWISSKIVHHTTAIDSAGRFSLTIFLPAETDLWLDDARLNAQTIAIPGETIYFTADLNNRSAVKFSGENAQLHTEIHRWFLDKQARKLPDYTDSEWFNQFSGQALVDTIDAVYRNNLRFLQAWQQANQPEIRTMQYIRAHLSYEAAMPLTQAVYQNRAKQIPEPDEPYFRHIDSMIVINGNTGYLSQHFLVVHRDFRNHSNSKARTLQLNADSIYQKRIHHPREKEITEIWVAARPLKEGYPIKDNIIADLRTKVQDTLLLNNLIRRNDAIKELIAGEQLLTDTRIISQFPDLKTADEIFGHITTPYRGKVIYIDIWGTWCSPCLEMMQYMPAIKKEYAGKDVVFLYLAIKSPEAAWKKTILEHKMTGPAVVHYRLSNEMQDEFEKKFSLKGFPSYFLIGKDGSLVTTKAPWPRDATALHKAINELL